jgi:hypothetical protein
MGVSSLGFRGVLFPRRQKLYYMTAEEYRVLLEDRKAAAHIVDWIRRERCNFCIPPDRRPAEDVLKRAEAYLEEINAQLANG